MGSCGLLSNADRRWGPSPMFGWPKFNRLSPGRCVALGNFVIAVMQIRNVASSWATYLYTRFKMCVTAAAGQRKHAFISVLHGSCFGSCFDVGRPGCPLITGFSPLVHLSKCPRIAPNGHTSPLHCHSPPSVLM